MSEARGKYQSISESDFLATVIGLAEAYHWKIYHVFEQRNYARRTSAGFPDLVLARGGMIIFAELKKEGKNPTEAQEKWLRELDPNYDDGNSTHNVYVWRPSDLDEIEDILR